MALASRSFDVAVIGGGIVGASIALGLARRGAKVALLDEAGRAFRASRGNFGLVWVQGKGLDRPAYARLSRRAADAWASFAAGLHELTDVDPGHRRSGGWFFCHTEAEFEAKRAALARIERQTDGLATFEMIDHDELARRLPGIGPGIHGASYTPHDGGADPLRLLRALHTGVTRLGGQLLASEPADVVVHDGHGFHIGAGADRVQADRVVLAAGLGNRALAPLLGLTAPVRPVRGQILVTERLPPFLEPVTNMLRQMSEGTCLIGDTSEEVGLDDGVLVGSMELLAARAVAVFPHLAAARVVRAWGALRVMSPDGLPIYARSPTLPGAWLATVHSGVTLAPFHHDTVAASILADAPPPEFADFSPDRFDEAAAIDPSARRA